MGKTQCRNGLDLKRGPWTPEEDQKLFAYIQKNGHRNWSSLPQKAGLRRCGKSCRIRWINYLRPDIRRGKFTPQEEQTIIQLHALLGNRWSIIAAFLNNRTDNEIKNYWNCRLKKKLAKMGIDPSTHKRKTPTIVGLSNTTDHHEPSKNAAKIIHMAQWESTRLEAEARLVRKSKLENRSLNSLESEILSNLKAMPHLYAGSLDFQPHEEVVVKPPCLDILKAWQIVAGACVSLDHDADSIFNNKPHEFSSSSFIDNDLLRFEAVTSSGSPCRNFRGVTDGVTVLPAAAATNESISNLQSFFPSGCISSTEDFGAANAAIFDNSDDIWCVDEPIDDMGSQLNSLDDFWDDLLPCDFSEEKVVKNEGFFSNGDHGGRAGDQEVLGCSLSYCGRLGSLLMR